MKRAAIFILLAAIGVLAAGPQISSFYEPDLDDWVLFAVDEDGGLHRRYGGDFSKLAQVPGSGPYDVSAFYEPDIDEWMVFTVNGLGEVQLYDGEFI